MLIDLRKGPRDEEACQEEVESEPGDRPQPSGWEPHSGCRSRHQRGVHRSYRLRMRWRRLPGWDRLLQPDDVSLGVQSHPGDLPALLIGSGLEPFEKGTVLCDRPLLSFYFRLLLRRLLLRPPPVPGVPFVDSPSAASSGPSSKSSSSPSKSSPSSWTVMSPASGAVSPS